MFDFLKNIVGKGIDFAPFVTEVNAIESEIQNLTNEELKDESGKLSERLKNGETTDDILPRAYALVREAAKRTLGQRHYDVQLMGGVAIHKGAIAEMMTGEGKTLAATLPVYLNALTGRGVHVVTVNEYLAKRDTVWMGQIYQALGLTVSCLIHEGAKQYDPEWKVATDAEKLIDKERDTTGSFLVQEEFLRPVTRRAAYETDITYGTNHEFGFDYLRDHLAYAPENRVQRGHFFAVIDEIDSILIDEARTPLIISAPDAQSSDFYKVFSKVVEKLQPETDYAIDEKMRTVTILDAGIDKVEKMVGIKDFYAPENIRLVRYLEESLRAKALFTKDKDYVVKNNEIIIVDQFTGRLMLGRRYSGGLHQAIEAKESVQIKEESRTYASISIQNYFRMYEKLGGMTGTAQTSAEEFHKVYNLEVMSIPPNRPLARKDHPDVIYKNIEAKYQAVVEEVRSRNALGQPVLLGTSSIEKNEKISALLFQAGIKHEVLNAKNNEREGAIIAQAGKLKAVTVATNVAGRGVDIILGGNPSDPEEAKRVRELGGLFVLGTERHEARRIDNQLRGRAGRQGDPGESKFYLSLEDDLLRIFGGERITNLMNTLNVPEDTPIESRFLSGAVSQAQGKVEGFNFDARKHLLEYDDILNKQRQNFYARRDHILEIMDKGILKQEIVDIAENQLQRINNELLSSEYINEWRLDVLKEVFTGSMVVKDKEKIESVIKEAQALGTNEGREKISEFLRSEIAARAEEAAEDPNTRGKMLGGMDLLWITQLEDMEALMESVRLRAYAQHDPLVEYRKEGHRLYTEFWNNYADWLFSNLFRSIGAGGAAPAVTIEVPKDAGNIGRNDPCPCGSGLKYKKCGLINAPEHKK